MLKVSDPFPFEPCQLEAFGFCPFSEGRPYVFASNGAFGWTASATSDGGHLSFGHARADAQIVRRAIRVETIHSEAKTSLIRVAEFAVSSTGGGDRDGAGFTTVGLRGKTSAVQL